VNPYRSATDRPRGRAVDIGGLLIRPVPANLNAGCMHCRTETARWELARTPKADDYLCCSICLLYEHPTLKDQRDRVDELSYAVETKMERPFARDTEGRLTHAPDADRLAGAIVVVQRYSRIGRAK